MTNPDENKQHEVLVTPLVPATLPYEEYASIISSNTTVGELLFNNLKG